MQCTDSADSISDTPRCPNEATVLTWSDAPGWQEKKAVCEHHAHIFERVVHRHFPLYVAFTCPIPTDHEEDR